ncbi:hypothetical protein LRS03_09915 [Rhizobacter sp. J219]|jgi:hypothetical protein|uniref:hypothetical protein n=1 Tax=Rhizobacter sp. J219 TaxID=2898430 RepID=UPI00215122BA|nr:hypothetical protein [Rhizobacter sp. J219]MCR5883152.1 hypothetical protein [Rhizobacter sp. J219]
MNAVARTLPESFRVLLTLAQLLERMERRLVPMAADQYRSVVDHLSKELADVPPGDDLDFLLQAFPATAELYENLQYAHAGLCRSPLDASLQAELQARDVFKRL